MATVYIKVRRDADGKLTLASDVKEFINARNSGASIIAQDVDSGEVTTVVSRGGRHWNTADEVIVTPGAGVDSL